MKKFLFALLALLVLAMPVMAQNIDISTLPDADLQYLYELIKTEMSRRGLDSVEVTLGEGKYIVGRDIPAGNYTIVCLSTEGESLSGMYNSLGSAYDSLSGDGSTAWGDLFGALGNMMNTLSELEVSVLGDYGDVLRKVTLKKDASVDLTLSAGTALQISEGTAKLIMKK